MDLQKKKGSSRKSKLTKTDSTPQMPLAPLIHEINLLKSQLASINAKKAKKVQTNQTQSAKSGLESQLEDRTSLKLYSSVRQSELVSICFPIREYELKMNLQLNKLQKAIKANDNVLISEYLCSLVKSFNEGTQQFSSISQSNSHSNSHNSHNSHSHSNLQNWRQQARVYQQLNNQLQKQHIQIKHAMTAQISQMEILQNINIQLKHQYDNLSINISILEQNNQKLSAINHQLTQQNQQMAQQIKIYERTIQQKQSEIIMFEQDVKHSHLQSQKHKLQRKQTQKMYDNIQKQYKQFRIKIQSQVDLLNRQKNKWQTECQDRRAHSQAEINSVEQNTILKKEVEENRKQNQLLSEQISQLKTRLHEQMKNSLKQQQKSHKIQLQNQRNKNNIQVYKSQIRQMQREVDGLRQQCNRFREMVVRGKAGASNQDKALALGEIQQLIRMHKDSNI